MTAHGGELSCCEAMSLSTRRQGGAVEIEEFLMGPWAPGW